MALGKLGLEPDRAGGLNDLVVDEVELAFIELDLVVLAVGEDRERPLGHLLLDFRQDWFRGSEKISEIGWIWVTTTRPLGSVGWMMLPISTWRMPVTPSIGEVSRV